MLLRPSFRNQPSPSTKQPHRLDQKQTASRRSNVSTNSDTTKHVEPRLTISNSCSYSNINITITKKRHAFDVANEHRCLKARLRLSNFSFSRLLRNIRNLVFAYAGQDSAGVFLFSWSDRFFSNTQACQELAMLSRLSRLLFLGALGKGWSVW
ncbi:hypothetical protein AUEXF2481DRAFT_389020 [Aureobasidium subglaciale EXF-2481]|uniref:Uncharacterized protein n=1 Tax=Aureobasidium subglaciale (strain EXF-2481) TaxID=1043005 RepID=A0A074YMH0_AURSE|nr:uncharacterized protein AUEXF2481DRAFT_389020 [Aureobasidium subglaciale EXF-2481]KEQ99003.1 hypothetical protein AUEXF2481DRAFT_389020 [Aureobasidium subglaciale EXF-2481]